VAKKKRDVKPEKPFRQTVHHIFKTFDTTMGLIGRLRPDLWTKWQRFAREMLMAAAEENGLLTEEEVAYLPSTTPLGEKSARLRAKLEEWCHGLIPDGVDIYQYEDAEGQEIQKPVTLREVIDEIVYAQHLRSRTPELLSEFRVHRDVLAKILDEEDGSGRGELSSPETTLLSERAMAALRNFREWFKGGPEEGKK